MAYGTIVAYGVSSPTQDHFGGPLAPFPGTETPTYIALTAFLLNLVVVVVLTPILRALDVPDGEEATSASDYSVDAGGALRASVAC